MMSEKYNLIFVLLLWSSYSALGDDCFNKVDKDVYIRPRNTKWALDGYFYDEHVKLMNYILPSRDQRWRFEPSSNVGYFNIINKTSKKALDLDSNYDNRRKSYNVTTNTFEDSPSQQWLINWDGTITNGFAKDHVLDVFNHKYTDRNYIVVTRRRGNSNTKFFLTLKDTDQYS